MNHKTYFDKIIDKYKEIYDINDYIRPKGLISSRYFLGYRSDIFNVVFISYNYIEFNYKLYYIPNMGVFIKHLVYLACKKATGNEFSTYITSNYKNNLKYIKLCNQKYLKSFRYFRLLFRVHPYFGRSSHESKLIANNEFDIIIGTYTNISGENKFITVTRDDSIKNSKKYNIIFKIDYSTYYIEFTIKNIKILYKCLKKRVMPPDKIINRTRIE